MPSRQWQYSLGIVSLKCRESGASLRWNTILWMGSHLMQGMRGRRPYFAEELPTLGKAHSKLLQLLRDQTWSAEPDMECSPIPGDDVRASAAHAVEPLRAVGLLESAPRVGVPQLLPPPRVVARPSLRRLLLMRDYRRTNGLVPRLVHLAEAFV